MADETKEETTEENTDEMEEETTGEVEETGKTSDKTEVESSEEEEFNPPISDELPQEDSDTSKEEKRFWYELRQLNKRFDHLEQKLSPEFETGETIEEKPPASKEIEEKAAAVLSELKERERKIDIKNFIREHPEFSKYKEKIEKTALHPAYEYVPVDFIAQGFAYGDTAKVASQKSEQAKAEAENSKTGGNPIIPLTTKKKVWELSKKEFEKLSDKVRRKGRK